MQLTFLGTAAANAFPEPFCACANCRQARREGGRSLRRRAAALVDDALLLDLGPDVLTAAHQFQVDLTGVRYCLQTHPHADHLDLSHLLSRSPGFGVAGAPRLHFYASAATLARADATFRRDLAGYSLFDAEAADTLNAVFHEVTPLHPFNAGPYQVVAFPAAHAPGMGALLYAVSRDGATLFYGTDTSILDETTWQALFDFAPCLDLVILDHTYGPDEAASDHLNAAHVAAYARRLRAEGLLRPQGRVVATHIAHEGNPAHAALARFAAAHGYEVAYDGLVLTL